MKNHDNTVEILWTGGFDSSFRVVQLSKLPVKIKPYYLSDHRASESRELLAIKNIIVELKKKEDTRCTFLDLEIVLMDEREKDEEISRVYNDLLKEDFMGSQYEWLACFAKNHKGIEMYILDDGRINKIISKYGSIKKIMDPLVGELYVIDKQNSHQNIITLFGNYSFPLLGYTKVRMKEEYIRLKCEDVMEMTWFCYTPIDGKFCGKCNPCTYTINEGLSYRFTPEALKRYEKRKRLDKFKETKLGRILRKIKNGFR